MTADESFALGRYGHVGDDVSDHGRKLFDQRFNTYMVRVLPGDYYVTGARDETIVTVLGSCVAACIRNPYTGFGGMNHFMLPESESGSWNGVSSALRYGNFAMEALINEVLKSGCRRVDLEIKLFGGASMGIGQSQVGNLNGAFARDYLASEGLFLSSSDLGGSHGRRIHYCPATGKVQRRLLHDQNERQIVAEEDRYGKILRTKNIEGDIELFE
jgi:chemotaxis protein CheD